MSTPSTILPSFTFTNASTTTAPSSCGPCPWLMIEPGLATWSPGNSSIPALRSTQLYVDPNYNTTSTSISCNSAAISAYTPADDYWINDKCELVAKYLAFAVGTEWFWETVTLTETAGSSLRVGGLFSAGGPITTTNDDGQSTCTNGWVTRFPTMVTYTDPVIETISGGNAFWLMPDLSKYFPDLAGVEQCTLIMPGGSPVALTPANDIKLPVITLDFTRSSTVPSNSRTTSSSNADPTTTQARPGGGSNTELPTETSTSQAPPSPTTSADDSPPSTTASAPSAIIQPSSTGTLIVPPQEVPEDDEDSPAPTGGNESSPEPSDSADPDEEDRPSDDDEPPTPPSGGSSDNDNEDRPSDDDEPSTPPLGGSSNDGNDNDESSETRPTQPATIPAQESNDESNDDNPSQNDSPINPAEDDSSDSSGGNSNQQNDDNSDEANPPSNDDSSSQNDSPINPAEDDSSESSGGNSNQQNDNNSDESNPPSNEGNSNQQNDGDSDEADSPSNGSPNTSSDPDDNDSSSSNPSQQGESGNSDDQQSPALGETTQAAGAQPTAGGSNGNAPSSRTIPVINTNQPSIFLTNSGSALVVGPSATISAGGQVATAGGTTFSVLPSSQGVVALANGESSTIDASSLTSAAGNDNDVSSAPHIVEAPDSQGFVVDELSITAGGAAATISGSTFSALPSGSGVVVIADGQSTTVAGSSLAEYGIDTSSEAEGAYGLPNQSLSPGGPAATIQGTTYSALPGSSGIVVKANGATTTLDAAEATKVATEATRIPSVDTISAVQSVSNGYIIGDSVTVTVGGAPTTISGTVYSALPSGGGVLAVDENDEESDDFAPFIEQGISGDNGEADGDESGSYVVAGDVTITVGESAATVSGTVYSALPSGSGVVAVADGQTTTRAASTTRSGNGPEATDGPGDDGDDENNDDDVVAVYDGDSSAATDRMGVWTLACLPVLFGLVHLL